MINIIRAVAPVSFSVGQGDEDSLSATLLDNSAGVDLSGATVFFNMKNDLGTVRRTIDCGDGSANGVVSVPLADTDTATPGLFFGEFVVDFPGGSVPGGSDNYFSSYFSSGFFGSYYGAGGGTGSGGQRTYPDDSYVTVKIKKAI